MEHASGLIPLNTGLSHMARRKSQLGVFPSPSRGPRDACVAGWLWGGARGGGTLANKEREESAPTPTPPHARSASTLLAGEGSMASSLHHFRSNAIACPCRGGIQARVGQVVLIQL